MKTTLIAVAAAATLALTGCGLVGGGTDTVGQKDGDVTKLTVGATPVPQGDILRFVDENLAADAGLDIDVKEYTDYTLPNKALSDGDIDANYFQHKPYLDSEIDGQGYEITGFEPINLEPFALFSNKVKDVKDLPEGAKIGINNDPANQGRALKMLEEADLITLNDGVNAVSAKLSDVRDNPKNIEFVEADAAQLARTLQDVDASVINGNNALEAGLSPAKDGILIESAENNPYGNFLAVRTENKDDENIKKLNDLLHTPEVKKFIEEKWSDGSVLPSF
ncbi:MetQ/NlpA family ABC transporter substrate-binding protein [Brevibacterium casei]|uniref:MetQ/NlpA family ABC transporter substrate-binding protein n=1 Tax=Brevibacterium casei TaxID=33889 RepID=UPI00092590F4|nr:MetQ/NlpA family ABC transporter substrate-binding protein [Brevibacterium casei]MCT1446882.1 MetQ/NlpA family ABC transporter substrate-binding protein [Brevibacterium casei]MCT2181455.1 MetQ/NlpA family ABC transporter substrate-binding protein [Brevibacterium casei]QQT70605.1 MetQ/NlpA family ABC transporter substrate-binding protein [Brevibacterium casei]SIH97562.1 ABC transporter substrate-binding protein [Mycobacteroides abscessus subsp. abscessus]